MYKLLAVTFFAAIAIVLSNRCHVIDNEATIHCNDVNNMTCKGVEYTPYCHRTSSSNDGMNGVCSCEKMCFTNDECKSGCSWSSRYVGVCQEVYHNSIEKVCLCQRTN